MATATQLSVFSELTPLKRIYTARRGNLRCCAIRLKDDSLCLFSPVAGLNAAARASLEEIGEVTFLLAPNHYHNKALAEHAAAFPKAKLCATRAATPRLKKQTNLSFIDLARVTAKLSRGYSFVEPVGLKTGEVWFAPQSRRIDDLDGGRCDQRGQNDSDGIPWRHPEFVGYFSEFRDWRQGGLLPLVQSATH